MKVEQIMNRDVKTCGPQDSLNKTAQIMWEESCGAVPVVDEQSNPIGFLTDRDICMAAYTQGKPLDALRVETAMARKVVSCGVEDDLGFRGPADAAEPHAPASCDRSERRRWWGYCRSTTWPAKPPRTLRGGVNDELRNLVLEVHLSINRGRMRLHPAA